jgi:hypothetical protein
VQRGGCSHRDHQRAAPLHHRAQKHGRIGGPSCGNHQWRLRFHNVDDRRSACRSRSRNKSRGRDCAQRVPFAAAVDAITHELAFDFYSFQAKKGDTVSIDVIASRLGSKLDPVLRVLDAQKREIAFCEDASGAARDCRLQFRPPATGEYLLEVRDIAYGGGPEYFYRLRLGKFGFATCTFPIVAVPGQDVSLLSPSGERLKSVTARGRYADASGGFVTVRTAELAQSFEREPNDALQKASPVEIPTALNGRFEKPEDADWFHFKADKDERLVFLTKSRSAGSPCDVFLEVRDAEGKAIAESNPVGAQDTALTNKFASAGDYFLVARELAGRGAPDFAYQIEVRKFEPGFTLAVDEVKFEAKNGAEFSIPISCARYDFNDKIALKFPGLPDGFTFENATIEEKKTNATVKIKVPPDAAPGTLLAFSVVGSAGQKEVTAGTMSALQRDRPLLLNPPPELDGVVVLGVTGADPCAPVPTQALMKLSAIIGGLLLAMTAFTQSITADLLITNAVVRTMDTNQPLAEAVAMIGNRIVALGSNAKLVEAAGPKTKIIDAQGRLVLPGFNDAHVHFLSGGFQLSQVDLRTADSPAELTRRIKGVCRPRQTRSLDHRRRLGPRALDRRASPHQTNDRRGDNERACLRQPARWTHGTCEFNRAETGGNHARHEVSCRRPHRYEPKRGADRSPEGRRHGPGL